MRICILGGTGLVGRETLELAQRAWPDAQLDLYASRDQELEHGGKKFAVAAASQLEQATAARGDLAFVALDDEHSKRYVPRLLELGYRVIDKSNTYRADPKVPLVVAGVNGARVDETVRLVANPNCTTIPLALALQPLLHEYGLQSVTVSTYQAVSGAGIVAFDGGYREFGHETAQAGIRAFRWVGNDGGSGEILLPAECRKLADLNKRLLSKLDTSFLELGLPYRSRHHYRSALMRSGVRTEWENAWLGDERRLERRVAANRKRIENLRRETYLQASRELLTRYSTFIFEDTKGQELRDIGTDKQALRRSRQNRDLVAEYGFRELCERRGADVVTVDARNSTRECPNCGHLCKTTAKLLIQCESCNKVRDQDIGAARVLLRRGIEALEKRVASNQKAS